MYWLRSHEGQGTQRNRSRGSSGNSGQPGILGQGEALSRNGKSWSGKATALHTTEAAAYIPSFVVLLYHYLGLVLLYCTLIVFPTACRDNVKLELLPAGPRSPLYFPLAGNPAAGPPVTRKETQGRQTRVCIRPYLAPTADIVSYNNTEVPATLHATRITRGLKNRSRRHHDTRYHSEARRCGARQ